MAELITKIEASDLWPTLSALAGAGITTVHAAWLRRLSDDKPVNAALVRAFIDERIAFADRNPFEQSVDDQLATLRRANDEEKWGISEEDFARLALTAPAWPKGKHAYRSFRIRFGEGDEGVAKTFERHVARIKSVFGESGFWRWEHLHSSPTPHKGEHVERLRLLSGNHTHKACVEWVITDLDTHRKRESVTAVRDSKSLADELLVVAWLFPDMIKAIDYDKLPGLFAAGYEVNVPEYYDEAWQGVVIVDFYRAYRRVHMSASDRSRGSSICSVPVLRE